MSEIERLWDTGDDLREGVIKVRNENVESNAIGRDCVSPGDGPISVKFLFLLKGKLNGVSM